MNKFWDIKRPDLRSKFISKNVFIVKKLTGIAGRIFTIIIIEFPVEALNIRRYEATEKYEFALAECLKPVVPEINST